MRFKQILLLLTFLWLGVACHHKKSLFTLIDADKSGIHFANTITESDTLNILTEEYIYNGGGVGIGDFNNDGLADVYFTGNMVANRLYLNKGDLQFEDITQTAHVTGEGKWCSGVAVADVNQDGWLDVYVSATLSKDSVRRANLLYINKGLNAEGIPVFMESAPQYGIADMGNTTHAAFLDYDRDGDLDLYVLTNIINNKIPTNYRPKITNGTAINNDRLYRNNGNGTFTNVTKEAGIVFEGYGLGVAISDVNLDGWPDVYVTNDYLSDDLLYINNQNGTFTNQLAAYVKHTCYSAMGNDVVDINNDGLVDILALDMLPENNLRKKTMLNANNYITYINNEQFGYRHQYVRNVLQLNQGNTPEGHPVFSEIGQLAGIHQTDWSWTPLVADFDQDGFRDVIVTNGFPRDVTDHDFAMYRSGPVGAVASPSFLVDSIPVIKISNYAFRNNGDLTFKDVTKDWGMDLPSFSNGAAYADLDNDGDLDVVVNTINSPALLYKNQLNDRKNETGSNYLRVKLLGNAPNRQALGTKVRLHYGNGKQQFYEHTLYRGYLSTVENAAHFGLGNQAIVDSVEITWPDGKYQLLRNVKVNQVLTLTYNKADEQQPVVKTATPLLFRQLPATESIEYTHREADKIDFNLQRTLPHKYTQYGPGIAVGDVDGNGLDDCYVGGSAGKSGVFFLQQSNGSFRTDSTRLTPGNKPEEDMGVLLFDADQDGDLDLYAVSGSYEFEPESPLLQDRLYLNDGKGNFSLDRNALPTFRTSGSCVKAADFDQDGDLDLFVGGRVIPGRYPLSPPSYILRNDTPHSPSSPLPASPQGGGVLLSLPLEEGWGGAVRFTDVTRQVCPQLQSLGMVTDALWSDYDNDGKVDLVVAGEFMPLTFFKNQNGKLIPNPESGISNASGWWNSLTARDFDGDGDTDYVAGNLGLNTHYKADEQHPLKVYAKDFDGNGSVDPVLVCYMKNEQGEIKPFPMHTRDDLIAQMARARKQFTRYAPYGAATINEVLSAQDQQDALVKQATHFASSYVENLGNGTFRMKALPIEAQVAPVYGMVSQDVDEDGNVDLLLAGNDYGTEVFTGRYDAMTGLLLKGDGKGNFQSVRMAQSGFFADGDAKGMAVLYDAKGAERVVVTQNQDSLKVFAKSNALAGRAGQLISLHPMDAWAELTHINGKKQKIEFYYGSTYLSQSARRLQVPQTVATVAIYDYAGNRREATLASNR